MNKEISFLNKIISYRLRKNKRSRSLRVSIKPTGEVLVSSPQFVKETMIDSFIQAHAEWIFSKLDYFKKFTVIPVKGSRQKHYIEHKEKAREVITERLAYFNQYYKLEYKRVSIKNTSTRWGSCSSKKNLNFSYKLVLLPIELLDYVVVHELCHLKEMNHGPNFWKLVAEVCPDYKKLRAELKRHKL